MYFVGPMNLQWPRILKQIRMDIKGFFEMGGWESVLGVNEDEGNAKNLVVAYLQRGKWRQ